MSCGMLQNHFVLAQHVLQGYFCGFGAGCPTHRFCGRLQQFFSFFPTGFLQLALPVSHNPVNACCYYFGWGGKRPQRRPRCLTTPIFKYLAKFRKSDIQPSDDLVAQSDELFLDSLSFIDAFPQFLIQAFRNIHFPNCMANKNEHFRRRKLSRRYNICW